MNNECNVQVENIHDAHEDVSKNRDILRVFQSTFFAMRGLAFYPWCDLELQLQGPDSSHVIKDILQQTCLHPLCRKSPPSVKYRRLFLRELIKKYEASAADPSDELYDALGEVLGADEDTVCYKSYLLPTGCAISLCESVAAISDGTTGLVTWEAALYLAEWALQNPHLFKDRSVLELGCGVGLTGIVVCRSWSPRRYIFSDCHPTVLQRLRDNVQLNGLQATDRPVLELDWEAVSDRLLGELEVDTVIAADVVYDPAIISCLVELLSRILKLNGQKAEPDVFIASTIRNPDTYGYFKSHLEKAGISHKVLTEVVPHIFPYKRGSIEILKLFRVNHTAL